MKKLLLVRHAKASHKSGLADFERPLTHGGLQDTAVMAARLHKHAIIPQLLISSPALRTLTTANILAEHLQLPHTLTSKAIYDASELTLRHTINHLPQDHDFIGLVGHNPAISQILFYLTGQMRDVPPCAMALIEFDIDDWKAISDNTGNLLYYDSPDN